MFFKINFLHFFCYYVTVVLQYLLLLFFCLSTLWLPLHLIEKNMNNKKKLRSTLFEYTNTDPHIKQNMHHIFSDASIFYHALRCSLDLLQEALRPWLCSSPSPWRRSSCACSPCPGTTGPSWGSRSSVANCSTPPNRLPVSFSVIVWKTFIVFQYTKVKGIFPKAYYILHKSYSIYDSLCPMWQVQGLTCINYKIYKIWKE